MRLEEFYDLAKEIADWHAVTFKDADKTGQLLKLDEEFNEWLAEAKTDNPEKQITELADCFIVAAALWFRFGAAIGMFICKMIVWHHCNAKMYDAIVAKMEVNKERTRRGDWKKQADGSYHH
uniref:Pyrophosphatase n=1 Tax=Myoviridae sp. ctwVB15 TaxID=2825208 RepID=A0A8S5UNA3_9CAUD|nr:MAG TPA: pyrophosphatase [Myoviridae sp. ctwVB15]